jgi:two-component system NtrC family sensor kinase
MSTQNKQLIAEVFRGASTFSSTVTRSTRNDMLLNNREGLHRMIETIGDQEDIEVVRIFNKEGKIMFSTKKEETETYVDKNAEACYACHAVEEPLERLTTSERTRIFQANGHRVLAMITPIYNAPDCYTAKCHIHSKDQRVLGVLDIGMSLYEVDNDLKKNRKISIYFTLIAIFCVSVILALFVIRLVVKPVKQLVYATKRVAMGDLNVRTNVKTNDEIGILSSSFNKMIADLRSANLEIQSWNIELENKVEERTNKLRMAREQLVQSEKMASLGVLASSVAHEINNPLQGFLTYIKLMQKIISGKEMSQKRLDDFKNYLNVMGSEVERLGDMVKNLLVFSRQSKLEIRISDLNSIIKNSLMLLSNKIRIQNIEIDLHLQEAIPQIYCDFKQVQQTLMALMINAIEAMPKGGKIIITTQLVDQGKVEITITDTGEGIPKENLRYVFDPFFTTKEDAKGTGLGLFVAYGIIKDHKGTIKVESEIGKGTSFFINLPVEETQ